MSLGCSNTGDKSGKDHIIGWRLLIRPGAWPLPFLALWLRCLLAIVVTDWMQWGLHRLLHRVPWLWGIHKVHHSVTDGEMATRHNRRFIAAGRGEPTCTDRRALPYPESRFDKVYSVRTLYFWSDAVHNLREMLRVMKPGGRLVLGFRPTGSQNFPSEVYRLYTNSEVQDLLLQAGFVSVRLSTTSVQGTSFAIAERAAL